MRDERRESKESEVGYCFSEEREKLRGRERTVDNWENHGTLRAYCLCVCVARRGKTLER